MSGANLLDHGDADEQKRWPEVQKHFPLYEEFWRVHVVTLRDGHGMIRGDIDARLELMAQAHYKCFVSVSIALDNLSDLSHPERIFSSLQNAANRAKEVVICFNSIRRDCVAGHPEPMDPERLRQFCRDIADYRNFVHEDVMGIMMHEGKRYIPKCDRLKKYARWSRLRNPPLDDFTDLENALKKEFKELCDLLMDYWGQMLKYSSEVLASANYASLN